MHYFKKKLSGDEFFVEKKVPVCLRICKTPLPQEEQFDKLENSDEDIKNIISDNKTSYIYRKFK